MLRVENRGVIPGGCIRARSSIYDEMRMAVEPPMKHLRNMTAKANKGKRAERLNAETKKRGKRKAA